MDLGSFSVSLAVQDVAVSRAFYEKLGFAVVDGEQSEGWLVMRNGAAVVGLFQGMFERNVLTFNPGSTPDWLPGQPAASDVTDVRDIQEQLTAAGVELTERTDPDGTGPAHIALVDPDGNPILVDQHVPRPEAG